ncbi:hypothetical protein O988_08684, partial [Pseudogymnoascus sp. VKM F-3808]
TQTPLSKKVMSIPHPTTQPANSPTPPHTHQSPPNSVGPLTNHVHPSPPTVTITPSHIRSLGTATPRPPEPKAPTRPSGTAPAMAGQQRSQLRASAGTPTAASFATRIAELDDPTAAYMRELIESVEATRIGEEALRSEGRGEVPESCEREEGGGGW